VYATLLLMSSTLGGDVAPAPGAVAHPGHGCIGAPAPAPCCDSGGHGRVGLLGRIHARHAAKGGCCGQPAPDCCAPAPAPVVVPAAPCCDPCDSGGHRRSRGHHRKSSDCCAPDPCATPCATPGVPPVVVTPGTITPPKDMPKPVDKPKDKSPIDEAASNIPSIPIPSPLPSVPSAPVAGKGTPY
jgi:hypothetical protein